MPITTYSPSKAIQVTEVDMKYVDRGAVSTYDFTKADLIIDSTWHDLNLSAIVPEAAANHLVHLIIVAQTSSSTAPKFLSFGQSESGNKYNRLLLQTQVSGTPAGISYPESGWVMLDSNRVIEYNVTGDLVDYSKIDIAIRGWWTD